MKSADAFRLSSFGRWTLARALPGFTGIMLAVDGELKWSALSMTAASAADLIVDSVAGRLKTERSASDIQIEGFVDALCFVCAPVVLILAASSSFSTRIACGAFTCAGIFRLARFNVIGVSESGYLGLPVSYSGIVVPTLLLAEHYLPENADGWLIAGGLALLSALMVSRRFVVKRLSL